MSAPGRKVRDTPGRAAKASRRRGPSKGAIPARWKWIGQRPTRLSKALLAWFRKNARDLPWRHDRSPYRVWVSELMLQQTQVATVIPYYERWMGRFPSLESLAKAELPEVLRHWEGLGYYRRARFLHAGARRVMDELGGVFPGDYEGLLAMPGVGRYTAGAIASLAYGLPHPVVDGNVERVLLRLAGDRSDPKRPAVREGLWSLATALLPEHDPGAMNEALMELGATVCTPASPRCPVCPWKNPCRARIAGNQENIPRADEKAAARKVERIALVTEYRGTVLIERRGETGRLAGLWQFPETEWRPGRSNEAQIQELAGSKGVSVQGPARLITTVRHSIMSERVTTRFYAMHSASAGRKAARLAWVPLDEIAKRAMPIAHRKAVRAWRGRE